MTTTEKQKIAKKKWDSTNKDKIRLYKQNFYAKHRDLILEKSRNKSNLNINSNIKLEEILNAISEFYKIKVDYIKSELRSNEVSKARHIYFYLAKLLTNEKLYTIAIDVNRNHSTVLHGFNNISNQLDIYLSLREEVFEIKQKLIKQDLIIKDIDLLQLLKPSTESSRLHTEILNKSKTFK